MRIAAIQHDIVWEDREANFARLAPHGRPARSGAGAELVLLTETFSTGFSMTPGHRRARGRPVVAVPRRRRPQEHDVWVGRHLPGDRRRRASCPTTPSSSPAPTAARTATARSTPSPTAASTSTSAPATEPVTVQVEGLRVTLFVCYDLRFADEFWEPRRTPTSTWCRRTGRRRGGTTGRRCCRPGPSRTRRTWSACNRVGTAGDGTEHAGDSRIIGPMGELLATAAGRARRIVLADVDPAEVAATRDRFQFLADRRGPAGRRGDQRAGSTHPRSRPPLQRSGGSPSAARASRPDSPKLVR